MTGAPLPPARAARVALAIRAELAGDALARPEVAAFIAGAAPWPGAEASGRRLAAGRARLARAAAAASAASDLLARRRPDAAAVALVHAEAQARQAWRHLGIGRTHHPGR